MANRDNPRPVSLDFRAVGKWGIVAVVDGVDLPPAIGDSSWTPLSHDEARVVARMLQGWSPPEPHYERDEIKVTGPPIGQGKGWRGFLPVSLPARPYALPGGDEPVVDLKNIAEFRKSDGVPLLGCSCGSGIGCAAYSFSVSFARDRVYWRHGDQVFVFMRHVYDRGIKELLELVGEAPRLIDKWA